MTGLLVKKYHVAVFSSDDGFVTQVVSALKEWYNNQVVIKTYGDTHEFFEAINVNKAKKQPFDCAVLAPRNDAEKMVLRQSNPNLRVIVCKDAQNIPAQVSRGML
jgi:hypothetical protein